MTPRTLRVVNGYAAAPAPGQGPGEPIPGMKNQWSFRALDRAVVYERKATETGLDGKPSTGTTYEVVGRVPEVSGLVTKRAEDGRHTAVEYRLDGPDGSRVVSEDDLDLGKWAGKLGLPKPSGRDALQAFATVIRAESGTAPEVSGIPYLSPERGLVLPDATSQEIGYRVTAGAEDDAREMWHRIIGHAMQSPRTLLVLGAVFGGPLVKPFDVPAHILNLVGDAQQGKSTTQFVGASLLGAPEGRDLFGSFNSSPLGIPQVLKLARYLPLIREEWSSVGLTLPLGERLLSQIVSGADRSVAGKDGMVRPSVGGWRSLFLSSSNAPMRRTGQTEDLAARLYEINAPFWPGWEAADEAEDLARAAHGWPLEWAVRQGMFAPEGIDMWRTLHREVTARLAPPAGGVGRTIAKTYAAWITGAEMLGMVLGLADLGRTAEACAAELLPDAVVAAKGATLPPGQLLWDALDSVRIHAAQFPEAADLPHIAADADSRRKLLGYTHKGDLWVLSDALTNIAREAGIENLSACIGDLKRRRVLVPGDGRNDRSRLAPRSLRDIEHLPSRMYRLNIERGKAAYEPEDGPETGPGPEAPQGGPEAPQGPETAPDVPFCLGCRGPFFKNEPEPSGYRATCDPAALPGAAASPAAVPTPAVATVPAAAAVVDEPTLPEAPEPEPEAEAAPRVPAQAKPKREPRIAQSIADRVAAALEKAGGDVDKATAALIKSAIPDSVELLEEVRTTGRYEFTAHPPTEPDILRKRGRQANQIWEARPNWTNKTVPAGTEVDRLDTNAAYLSALNTHLPIGALVHEDGPEFNRRRSGLYRITPPEWTHTDLPNPLGNREEGGPLWVTRPTLQLLCDLSTEKYGRLCEAPLIHESWTSGSSESLLRGFRDMLRDARTEALRTGDTVTLEYIKPMYSKFVSTMIKESRFNHWIERSDWPHIIRAQAHGNLWRKALKARQAGLTVYCAVGTDELHVCGDWRQVWAEGRALSEMKLKDVDGDGGTYKVGE